MAWYYGNVGYKKLCDTFSCYLFLALSFWRSKQIGATSEGLYFLKIKGETTKVIKK